MRVTLSHTQKDEYSFLVALIELPTLPEGVDADEIYSNHTIAAITQSKDSGRYSGVVDLTTEERTRIGNELLEWSCMFPKNEWIWCNLYE